MSEKSTLGFHIRSAYCIPHPRKAAKGGEDAFFACRNAVGVADGVGGWNHEGIDPGPYARSLMANSLVAAEALRVRKVATLRPAALRILSSAYRNTGKTGLLGSATAAVVAIEAARSSASSLTVGDSGVRLFKKSGEQFHASEEQYTSHSNCPLQLGPQSYALPSDGLSFEWAIEQHDVILVGTDGLFDNIFDEGLRRVMSPLFAKLAEDGISMREMQAVADSVCKKLCQVAFENSNGGEETPFSIKNSRRPRGKPDDITAVVAVATKEELQETLHPCPSLIDELWVRMGRTVLRAQSKL